MKTLKQLSSERKKQLLVVILFNFVVLLIVVALGIIILVDTSIKSFMMTGIYALLILVWVQFGKETFINFQKVVKYQKEK